jgi:hypothetical protein
VAECSKINGALPHLTVRIWNFYLNAQSKVLLKLPHANAGVHKFPQNLGASSNL